MDRDHGLTYPIAIDNDFATWRALGNDAWPAKYLYDGQGRLVKRWVGEGHYDEIEAEIRRQLILASRERNCPRPPQRRARLQGPANHPTRGSPTRRTSAPIAGSREQSRWKVIGAVGGSIWKLRKGTGKIIFPFTAGEVNLVMEPGPSGFAAVTVLLDGQPVGEARGADVGADSVARFDRSGMLRLVAGASRRRHVLTLVAADPGVRAFVFTFGP